MQHNISMLLLLLLLLPTNWSCSRRRRCRCFCSFLCCCEGSYLLICLLQLVDELLLVLLHLRNQLLLSGIELVPLLTTLQNTEQQGHIHELQ